MGEPNLSHRSVEYRKKALPRSITLPMLRRQQARLYRAYADAFPPRLGERVLDLGVNGSLEKRDLYFFECSYPFPEQIVACGLEEPDLFASFFPRTRYVQGRREPRLPFRDGEFDLVFCNAVVEHVGSRDAQRAFLAEVLRVGRAAFVTTPNRWHPIELHTVLPLIHWLPTPWYRALLRRFGFAFFSREENLNLLDRRSLLALLPAGTQARLLRHRFLGFTSNLLLVARRAGDGGA